MVSRSGDAPDRGSVIWLNFNPQRGREQAGRRPALVLSPATYNAKVGLALVCPITTQKKGYPFEVDIPDDCSVTGVSLVDHVKSLDWRARDTVTDGRLPEATVSKTLELLLILLSR